MSAGQRLGVVLRQRELEEEAAAIELGRAVAAHQAAFEAVEHARAVLAVACTDAASLQRASSQGAGLVAGDLREATASVRLAEHDVATSESRAAEIVDLLDQAQSRLADATRRRDVVERLMVRMAAAARLSAQRREDSALNEIASVRHVLAALGETRR